MNPDILIPEAVMTPLFSQLLSISRIMAQTLHNVESGAPRGVPPLLGIASQALPPCTSQEFQLVF